MAALSSATATTFEASAGTAPKNTDSFRRYGRKLYDNNPHKDAAAGISFTEDTRRVVRELLTYYGMAWLEAKTSLHSESIYKMLAGYGEQCRPNTQRKLKRFLAGYIR